MGLPGLDVITGIGTERDGSHAAVEVLQQGWHPDQPHGRRDVRPVVGENAMLANLSGVGALRPEFGRADIGCYPRR